MRRTFSDGGRKFMTDVPCDGTPVLRLYFLIILFSDKTGCLLLILLLLIV